jgi:hypothetical protein
MSLKLSMPRNFDFKKKVLVICILTLVIVEEVKEV